MNIFEFHLSIFVLISSKNYHSISIELKTTLPKYESNASILDDFAQQQANPTLDI